MSEIIIELEKLRKFQDETVNPYILYYLRIFAQYCGISSSCTDCLTPILHFSTIPYFSLNKNKDNYYDLFVDESCYHNQFIESAEPLEGDILDLRCTAQYGKIEIFQLQKLSIREIERLRNFIFTDVGKSFFKFLGLFHEKE